MLLLRQRRSQPLLRHDEAEQVRTIRRTPTFSLVSSPNLSAITPGSRTTSLLRRVSSIFTGRSKRNGASAGIGHVANGCHRTGYSSPSLTSSEEDIRRPSGLGPRSTSFGSLPSPPIDRPSDFTLIGDMQERSRCKSSPEVLLSTDKPLPRKPLEGRLRLNGHTAPAIHNPSHLNIPPEILHVIVAYLPRHDVASLAVVSKSFAVAAQASLYGTIDFRGLQKAGLKQLTATLASRKERAETVHTFICHRWPASHASRIDPRTHLTTPPASTSKFALALLNMRNITSLTLPTFEAVLLNSTNFRLQSLTLLSQMLSPDEQAELCGWLALHPGITSLSLPNLVDPSPEDPDEEVKNVPSESPHAVTFPSLTPSCLIDSPSFLPALRILHASPTTTTLLLPNRSLAHVSVHINSTLYTGFRPSTLMDVLHGVPEIVLRFGESVDRRTVEKTMGAAGSVLTEGPSIRKDGKCALRELDVEVGWFGGGTDETLYKIIHSTLPRFKTLQTLRLRRLIRSPLSSRSPSQSHSSSLPPSPARSMPPPSPISTPPPKIPSPLSSSRPSSASAPVTPASRKRPTTILIDDQDDRDRERSHLEIWLKHCRTLRTVEFLSGTEWSVEAPQNGGLMLSPRLSGIERKNKWDRLESR